MLCYCFYSISSPLVGVDVKPGEIFQKIMSEYVQAISVSQKLRFKTNLIHHFQFLGSI